MPPANSVLWSENSVLDGDSIVTEMASRQLKETLNERMRNRGRGIYAEFDQLKATPINASTKDAISTKAQSRNRHDSILKR